MPDDRNGRSSLPAVSTAGGTLGVWDSQDSAEHGQLDEREVRGVNVDSVRARGRGVIGVGYSRLSDSRTNPGGALYCLYWFRASNWSVWLNSCFVKIEDSERRDTHETYVH